MNPIRAIIIDDEESARGTLRTILESQFDNVQVVGEASGVKEGLELIQNTSFNLLFLDIQMPDGTGFDLLKNFDDIQFQLIFTTAFDKYAIKAFDFSAIGYLLKPISIEELENSLDRVHNNLNSKMSGSKDQLALLHELIQLKDERANKIAIPTVEGFEIIATSELIRCEGDRNYTKLILDNGMQLLSSKTLKKYEDILSEHSFMRIHKSHLINLKHVKRYIKGDGGSVELTDGAQIQISRDKKETFNTFFQFGDI